METTHRYRLLIYFAVLVLCLSVCFANAECTGGHAGARTFHKMQSTRANPGRLVSHWREKVSDRRSVCP